MKMLKELVIILIAGTTIGTGLFYVVQSFDKKQQVLDEEFSEACSEAVERVRTTCVMNSGICHIPPETNLVVSGCSGTWSPKVEWNVYGVTMGLREDGVVVWRKDEKLKK